MASPYGIPSYLLDRANIHDAPTRMAICVDTKSTDSLIRDVYAPQVEIDHTSLLGGEPAQTTGEAWARSLEPMGEAFDSTQHVYTYGAEGGPMMHNGGIAYFEVIRLREVEERGENSWRISKQRVVKLWEEGNEELMKP